MRGGLGLGLPCVLPTRAQAGPALAPLQRGVALGLFSEDPLFSYGEMLRELRDLGASHVSLTLSMYQEHGGSTEIFAHPRFTAPDFAVARTITEAHALGLKVMLFPILRLLQPRTDREWRGTLSPTNPAAWWRAYEARMVSLSRLAAKHRVAVLSIGSELSTLDGSPYHDQWQRVASSVRREFKGLLTYSGNWDHFADVGLYDVVDLAGMCAYFPLSQAGYKPPIEQAVLTDAWRRRRVELEAFAEKQKKPLLLTEVGYLSQRGAAAWPWKEAASEPVDLEDQRRCYQAFAEAWTGSTVLRGVYFWNYFGFGGRSSGGYTPRHKPAAQELERYFLAESPRPAD